MNEDFYEVAFPDQGEFIQTDNGHTLRKIEDSCYVYGLDMLLTAEQVENLDDIINSSYYLNEATRGTIITQTKYNWPNKTVPYTFNSNLTTQQKFDISIALNVWRTQTQIQFVPRNKQKDYVEFVAGVGNSSYVGKIGGRQVITMDAQQGTTGNMIHEIGHAVGMIHEHQNFMRDQFIIVHENNIKKEYWDQYKKLTSNQHVHSANSLYDVCFPFSSIMMYSSRSGFGITPTAILMTAINPLNTRNNKFIDYTDNTFIAQRRYLSASDRAVVAWKYGYQYDPATDTTLTDDMKGY